jgi:hypothetical protein
MHGLIGKARCVAGKRRPLLATFGEQIVTEPVGGYGLAHG